MKRSRDEVEQARFDLSGPGPQVNPSMITLARESRGLTQSELARRMAVTQGWLSKVENGLLDVSDENLQKLATELGYPPTFFSQPDQVTGIGTGEMFHRKRMSVSDRTLDKIHARVNIHRMHVARLLKSVDIGEWDFPQLLPDEFGTPSDVARALRAHWLLPKGPVSNVVKLIEDAGGIVIPFDFDGAKVDAISHWVRGLPPLFFINKNSPGDRLRFTLCHEIGHIVMHSKFPCADMEDQADEFSAEFLMPAQDIRPYLVNVTLPKLAALKPVWKVSMSALAVRADRLGMLTDRQKRSLWTQLGPLKSKEPAELDIPVEVSYLLDDIFQTYRDEMHYSVPELAAMLQLDEAETQALYLPKEQPRLRIVRKGTYS